MSQHLAIIGGTSGIGRATIAQLQGDGHQVHAACRSPEKLADLGLVAQRFDALARRRSLGRSGSTGSSTSPGRSCSSPSIA
ncbi:hypothetical protein EMGBD4_06430 [Verrucomicrobiota bacterium]|nr:hypothetical protein EMGBD4_06430 [Verrucomicrobiota bacterium]